MSTLPFVFHESLPSTSTRVQEELRGGRKPPFAIAARVQTSGRGRRGNAWQSHPGNIHLSLALSPQGVAVREAGLIPLYVAYLVASWVRERFGLRLTVKWPNDLLFAGKKLAGVLCEGTTAGDGWNELIIGVGLNLVTAPHATESSGGAIALASILPSLEQTSVEQTTEALARYFHERWRPSDIARAPDLLEGFALEAGQPWREVAELWHLKNVRADGAMVLSGKEERVLTSVDHGVRWVYQDPYRENVAVVECGNRRWKAQAWQPDGVVTWEAAGSYDAEGLDLFKRQTVPVVDRAPAVYVAGVNPDGRARLTEAAPSLSWVDVAKRPLRLASSAYDFHKIGFDRLAGIEGALRLFPQRASIVVSAGTALTVDVVDRQRRHVGGWIVPGLGMRLTAMHTHTKLLPLLSPDEAAATWDPDEPIGFGIDTRLAMAQGVGAELQAFLLSLRTRFASTPQDTAFVLTGGDAARLACLVPDAIVRNDLITVGMREMALGGTCG